MSKQEDIDKLFRDALHDQETHPGPEVWDKIAGQLDEEQNVIPMATSTRRWHMTWAKYAAAACLLISIGIGYFAFRNGGAVQQPVLVHHDSTVATPKETIAVPATHDDTPIRASQDNSIKTDPVKPEIKTVFAVTQSQPYAHTPSIHETHPRQVTHVKEEPVQEEHGLLEAIQYATIDPQTETHTLATTETTENPTFISVTEVDPIRPLIDPFEEEEEGMIAGTVRKTTHTVVNGFLNAVGDNISNIAGKEVKVSTDDEGSLRLDFGGLLARNKNKKRR